VSMSATAKLLTRRRSQQLLLYRCMYALRACGRTRLYSASFANNYLEYCDEYVSSSVCLSVRSHNA